MSESGDLFRKINNAVLDLQSSDFQTYPYPIQKLGKLLQHEDLQQFNTNLVQGVDLDDFIERGMKSRSSMVGIARLDWPDDEIESLGLQLLLVLKFGGDPDYMMNFAHTFYNSNSRKIIRDIQALTSQLIIPFVRDYKAYVESKGAVETRLQVPTTNKIFIVHGHDGEARETVARFVNNIGFEPIILHEQASKGRTIIEKVEANSDVGFAIVLLTPDDLGRTKTNESLEPRARQNVLLELGYFIGKLGRDKVCALRRGDVSIPSDFAGVVWEEMDQNGGWKQALARELKAAGHAIDWNKVMA